MNLLIFILSLIMILAAMTYSRVESYMRNSVQAQEWRWIMKESERDLYNIKQAKCNDEVSDKPPEETVPLPPGEKKESTPKKETEKTTKKATPAGTGKISVAWLFDKSTRESPTFDKEKAAAVIEQLIVINWKDQPFYRIMEKKRPQFAGALVKEMMRLGDKANEADDKTGKVAKPLKNLDDLIYLAWSDPELKLAFGRMLQEGLIYNRAGARDDLSSEIVYNSPKGFQSLKDFFTQTKKDKIRVWLAPKAILRVIFPEPEVVDAVIKMREQLAKEMKKRGEDNSSPLNDQFQAAFSGSTPFADLLDFTVTTTPPPKK